MLEQLSSIRKGPLIGEIIYYYFLKPIPTRLTVPCLWSVVVVIKLISILTHLEEVGGLDLGIKLGYSGQLSSVLGATQ